MLRPRRSWIERLASKRSSMNRANHQENIRRRRLLAQSLERRFVLASGASCKRASQSCMDRRHKCENSEIIAEYELVIEELNAADRTRHLGSPRPRECDFIPDRSKPLQKQPDTHVAMRFDLRAKFEPAENTINALQERLSEIKDRPLESY